MNIFFRFAPNSDISFFYVVKNCLTLPYSDINSSHIYRLWEEITNKLFGSSLFDAQFAFSSVEVIISTWIKENGLEFSGYVHSKDPAHTELHIESDPSQMPPHVHYCFSDNISVTQVVNFLTLLADGNKRREAILSYLTFQLNSQDAALGIIRNKLSAESVSRPYISQEIKSRAITAASECQKGIFTSVSVALEKTTGALFFKRKPNGLDSICLEDSTIVTLFDINAHTKKMYNNVYFLIGIFLPILIYGLWRLLKAKNNNSRDLANNAPTKSGLYKAQKRK